MKRRFMRGGRIQTDQLALEVDDAIIAQVRGTAPAGETLGTLRTGLSQSAQLHDIQGTYSPGDVSIGANGLVYTANSTEDWRTANGVSTGEPDYSDLPELGDKKSAWTAESALGKRWVFERMSYVTGASLEERVQNAAALVSSAGGGTLVIGNTLQIETRIILSSAHNNVVLEAGSSDVSIEAIGSTRTQFIFISSTCENITIRGFRIVGNGLATSRVAELCGVNVSYEDCVFTDRDQEALFASVDSVTSIPMLQYRPSADNCHVVRCTFTDCGTGISKLNSVFIGKNCTIVDCIFEKYSARGISAQPNGVRTESIKIIRPVIKAPPSLPNSGTGVIKQPIGFSISSANSDAYWDNVTILDIVMDLEPMPYINDNPADNPGEGSNEATRSVADAVSFHRVWNGYVRIEHMRGGGEVGGFTASQGFDHLVVEGGIVEDGDVCGFNFGASSGELGGDVILRNTTLKNCSRDVNHDHRDIAPVMSNRIRSLDIRGVTIEADAAAPLYSAGQTYSIDDEVISGGVQTDTDSGITWRSLVDNNIGNALVEGANWTSVGIPEPLRHCVSAKSVDRLTMTNNLLPDPVFEKVLVDANTYWVEADHITSVVDADWPQFTSDATNNGKLIYVSDLSRYELPDGAGGRKILTVPSGSVWRGIFSAAGVLDTDASTRENMSTDAVVANTNEFTITLDLALPSNPLIQVRQTTTTQGRHFYFEVVDSTTLKVITFNATGGVSAVPFAVHIRE